MLSRLVPTSLVFASIIYLSSPASSQETTGNDPAPKADAEAKTKTKTDASKPKAKVGLQKATFGGGCFWSMEAIFESVTGVKKVTSGFAGGNVPRPSYEEVCTGQTGHAEVVQVVFDPEVITYEQLLVIYWASHDPTTLNRQGEDEGTNYRSVVFFHDEDQREAVLQSYQKLTSARVFGDPIVTQLMPYRTFYPAIAYHQDYYRKHRSSFYGQTVIAPKLKKLKTTTKIVDGILKPEGPKDSKIAAKEEKTPRRVVPTDR